MSLSSAVCDDKIPFFYTDWAEYNALISSLNYRQASNISHTNSQT